MFVGMRAEFPSVAGYVKLNEVSLVYKILPSVELPVILYERVPKVSDWP